LQDHVTSPFLGGNGGSPFGLSERKHSERTQRRIDAEVSRLLEDGMNRARAIVRNNRDALGNVAARLLAVETIEGEELRRILTEAGSQVPRKGTRDDEVHGAARPL